MFCILLILSVAFREWGCDALRNFKNEQMKFEEHEKMEKTAKTSNELDRKKVVSLARLPTVPWTFSVHVLRKVSSEVTKVPLAELRRLIVMESKLSGCMERKDRKKMVKCGER